MLPAETTELANRIALEGDDKELTGQAGLRTQFEYLGRFAAERVDVLPPRPISLEETPTD
jgi:hypothetical protein